MEAEVGGEERLHLQSGGGGDFQGWDEHDKWKVAEMNTGGRK